MRGLGAKTDWSLAGMLYQLEGYNGWGYRLHHPHVLTPYLWSFSNHYTSGKYVAGGTWSDIAASKQCGAAVLLRRLAGNCIKSNFPINRGQPLRVHRWSLAMRRPNQVTGYCQAGRRLAAMA